MLLLIGAVQKSNRSPNHANPTQIIEINQQQPTQNKKK